MVTFPFSPLLVHANTWLLLPGSITNSEALQRVRPRVVLGQTPLSIWGDEDESNHRAQLPLLRPKRRPNKEAVADGSDELPDVVVVDKDEDSVEVVDKDDDDVSPPAPPPEEVLV
jgi:hypothetical protein